MWAYWSPLSTLILLISFYSSLFPLPLSVCLPLSPFCTSCCCFRARVKSPLTPLLTQRQKACIACWTLPPFSIHPFMQDCGGGGDGGDGGFRRKTRPGLGLKILAWPSEGEWEEGGGKEEDEEEEDGGWKGWSWVSAGAKASTGRLSFSWISVIKSDKGYATFTSICAWTCMFVLMWFSVLVLWVPCLMEIWGGRCMNGLCLPMSGFLCFYKPCLQISAVSVKLLGAAGKFFFWVYKATKSRNLDKIEGCNWEKGQGNIFSSFYCFFPLFFPAFELSLFWHHFMFLFHWFSCFQCFSARPNINFSASLFEFLWPNFTPEHLLTVISVHALVLLENMHAVWWKVLQCFLGNEHTAPACVSEAVLQQRALCRVTGTSWNRFKADGGLAGTIPSLCSTVG